MTQVENLKSSLSSIAKKIRELHESNEERGGGGGSESLESLKREAAEIAKRALAMEQAVVVAETSSSSSSSSTVEKKQNSQQHQQEGERYPPEEEEEEGTAAAAAANEQQEQQEQEEEADAEAARTRGGYEDAIEVLTHGTRVMSCDEDIQGLMYNNLACVERRNGLAEEAVLHLEDAIDCEGGEDFCAPSTLMNLSATVLSLGYHAAAVRVAQQAVKRILGAAKEAAEKEEYQKMKKFEAEYPSASSSSQKAKQQQQQQQEAKAKEEEEQEKKKKEAELEKEKEEKKKKKEEEEKRQKQQLTPEEEARNKQEEEEKKRQKVLREYQEQKRIRDRVELEKDEAFDRKEYRLDEDEDFVKILNERDEELQKFEQRGVLPPMHPPQLMTLAMARFNLGVALREMGDVVKGRIELEKAQNIFIDYEEQLPKEEENVQVQRIKASITKALSLPYHLGGHSPAKVNQPYNENEFAGSTALVAKKDNNNDDYNDNNDSSFENGGGGGGGKVSEGATPNSKSRSKFSKIRGLSGTPQPSMRNQNNKNKAAWDSTTSYGSPSASSSKRSTNLRNAGSRTPQPFPNGNNNNNGAAAGSSSASTLTLLVTGDGGGDLQADYNYNNNNNSNALVVPISSSASPAAYPVAAPLVSTTPSAVAAGGGVDPSIEYKLVGTYVPLRLVRLTEEVRFRESCRRVALTRARNEDLHDFKLLMQRESIVASEEERRVELEVEQQRLLAVTSYWIGFKMALLKEASQLDEHEASSRTEIQQDYLQVATSTLRDEAKTLHFFCEQDSQRYAMFRIEAEEREKVRRAYSERNKYFETKARLAETEKRHLACALSCWAWDCALRGENTISLVRPEMQQSKIVMLRGLTFGPGKRRR